MLRSARKSLMVAGSIGLVTTMAACSSGSSSDSGGDVTLTMWLWPGMGFAEKAQQYEEETQVLRLISKRLNMRMRTKI